MQRFARNDAFTLAETLIALVIVGVIAAITVPTLVNKYQEQQTISQLTASYSILDQALRMAELKHGKVKTWDIGTGDNQESSLKLYNYIAPEIKKLKECKSDSGCFADNYKTLDGAVGSYQPNTWGYYARGILNNGTSFYVWSNGSGCTGSYGAGFCGQIRVDLNGKKKPNRYGYDMFSFDIHPEKLVPTGKYNSVINQICKHSISSSGNGLGCTAWVLYKKNFDYKHRDVSW